MHNMLPKKQLKASFIKMPWTMHVLVINNSIEKYNENFVNHGFKNLKLPHTVRNGRSF